MEGTAHADAAQRLPEFPQPRTCPYHPPAGYRTLREQQGPLARVRLYDGRAVWTVVGHAEARALLTDPRLSSDWSHPGFPVTSPRRASIQKQALLIGMDAPAHTAYRRRLISAFTARRINELRPAIQRRTDELVDAILRQGPPAELSGALALPLSSLVICHILGVPYEDHTYFEQQTARLVARQAGEQDTLDALRGLRGYLDALIVRKEGEPGDGLIDTLVQEDLADGTLSREEISALALILLMAGHETTAGMITLGTLALLEHPDQLAAFRADPRLVPGAVEELLRFLSVADVATRVAAEDVQVGALTIREGDGVLLPNSAINRDPRAYPDPDHLDLARTDARHTAFGHGAHQCLGQNLARTELQIALHTLVTRIPTLRVAGPADRLAVKPADSGVQGIYELPLAW
ncbi:cytochrome P450 [Kitasatospora sp. NPDC056184]|uniref:cytochrome P450 n=1 Tax=Kitasatospora sp. NPDC056184 TaxID=3345738 RepID=UPI0035DC8E71